MPELSKRAKPLIQKVFDRAYLEQATGSAPWGVSRSGSCSYKAGCAIGRSLPAELAEQMGGTIQSILTYNTFESYFPRVRRLLLGTTRVPGADNVDLACYEEIQNAHDSTWRFEDREGYRRRLEGVAFKYSLTVPEPATKEQ